MRPSVDEEYTTVISGRCSTGFARDQLAEAFNQDPQQHTNGPRRGSRSVAPPPEKKVFLVPDAAGRMRGSTSRRPGPAAAAVRCAVPASRSQSTAPIFFINGG